MEDEGRVHEVMQLEIGLQGTLRPLMHTCKPNVGRPLFARLRVRHGNE